MYCQTMFGVSRDVMLVGLQTMEAENLKHYDIHCPKCRRANRVERRKLEMANPNWKEVVKKMAKEAAKGEKEQVADIAAKPASKTKSAPAKSKAASKSAAKKSTAKPAAKSKTKSTAKKSPAKKSTAKKATKAKKTTSKTKSK